MRICVVGTGYVGLVTGACFAEFGVDVTCVDKDADKIEQLRAGKIPIYEPGLEELVVKNVREERLHFTTETAQAMEQALVVRTASVNRALPGTRRGSGLAMASHTGHKTRKGCGDWSHSRFTGTGTSIASIRDGHDVCAERATMEAQVSASVPPRYLRSRPCRF